MNASAKNDDEGFIARLIRDPIRSGWFRRLFRELPRPALAVGADRLYRVIVKGTGFRLLFEGGSRPVVGFYTNRTVAACSHQDAKESVFRSVRRRRRSRGFESLAGCMPSLAVEESVVLPERFVLRSVSGLAFFPADSEG